jgi:hypothetical protein
MAEVTIDQAFSGVKFYNQNDNNDIIGRTINSTLDPTEELAQPASDILTGTITLTNGGLTVNGSSTVFTTEVQVGQLITAFVVDVPYLIGEVASIQSNIELTLKSNGPSPIAGSGLQFASTRGLIKPTANIYMMVPTIIVGNTFRVPTPRGLRIGYTDKTGALVDSSRLALSQYSESLLPNVEAPSLVPVNCYIRRTTIVPISEVSTGPVAYNGDLPTKYWYLIEGAGDLIRNTSFQLYTDELFDSFLVTDGVTKANLAASNTQANTGGYF